jgi:hypothetical protein
MNYLGDPGLSTGVPPTPTNFSVTVPAGQTLIVVVHTTNPGETGCPYTVTVVGDLCQGFDACIQNNLNPTQFILINTETGDYQYNDCLKPLVLEGTGVLSLQGCKVFISDSGPIPKRPDRAVFVEYNRCSFVGNASVRFPRTAKTATNFSDSDTRNNTCACQ